MRPDHGRLLSEEEDKGYNPSCVVSRIERVCVRIIRGLADVDLTPEVSRESLRGAFNHTHTHTHTHTA